MQLLAALTGRYGDSPDAVRIAGRNLSRAELAGAASAVADRIAGADVVAVLATPTIETVVGVVGAILAGVPVVALPPDSGVAERAHILRDSGAALVLTDGGDSPDLGLPVVPVDLRQRSTTSYPEPPPGRIAFILYTSGTTGVRKGVLISREAVAADLDALADAWAWTPEDVLVHGLPLFHVHGLVLGVLGALRIGSRLVHTGRPSPQAYAAAAVDPTAAGTLYFAVPTIWSRLCSDPHSARALTAARLLVSGSASLPVPVFERLRLLTGHGAVQRYGMTETLITVSSRADGERRPGEVGTPVRGIETRLIGEDGGPVPSDGKAIGELCVRGSTMFSGYLNRPDETARSVDADGWFRTGDIASIGPDGWHRIVGRVSTDLIKSGGFRIGAGEVEDALLAHPAVREAAVIGTPDADLGERVTAYVVADGVSQQQLMEFVAQQLSVHKRPRRVHLRDQLPRNAMGKVQKALLADNDPD
jgi:fatty acid CoA ligase FadD36